jgi:hypothetical protein
MRSPSQRPPEAWLLLHLRVAPILAILLVALAPAPTQAQGQPFVFNVTTGSGDADSSTGRWLARYDAGYAEQSAERFGYDGFEQRLGVQGKLGAGLTVLGQMGFGMAADGRTASTQEGELLKDVLPPSSRLRLAGGLGMRREWSGHGAALGRIVLGFTSGGTSLVGNVRFEKPLEPGRDALDVITSVGWLQSVTPGVHLGVEAVGEDLEGFWEPEEAEGGAKLFVGPTAHWAPAGQRFYASAVAGPILCATDTGRTSGAFRPLGATGNGFTARFSVGCLF